MVLLAKWILENNPNARVAIVTDRDELDKQIEASSARRRNHLPHQQRARPDEPAGPGHAAPAVLAGAQVRPARVDDFDAFIADWKPAQPDRGRAVRVRGRMPPHPERQAAPVMKALMPNAVFIGFTGTPLLKKDKQTSLEVFGGYIHTYKFSEAVEDGVVLDLVYEARDIDQRWAPRTRSTQWFDAKTKGLNDWQKDELKKQWGTMQNVLSSRSPAWSGWSRHRVRLQRQAPPVQRAGQCHPGGVQHLRGVQVLHAVPEDACSRASARWSPRTTRRPGRDAGRDRRQHETDKQFIYNTYTELLKDVAGPAGQVQDRNLRGPGQGALHQGAGQHEAAGRGGQAADRLRRAAAAPTSTSTSPCRTTACSRPSAAPTGSTARTRTSATSSTTRTCSRRSRTPLRCTPRAGPQRGRRRPRSAAARTA
jgi:type I restriction enzyme R subunit